MAVDCIRLSKANLPNNDFNHKKKMYCLIYSKITTYIDKHTAKHCGSHFRLKG